MPAGDSLKSLQNKKKNSRISETMGWSGKWETDDRAKWTARYTLARREREGWGIGVHLAIHQVYTTLEASCNFRRDVQINFEHQC